MRKIWQWLLATLAGLILILASPPIISQARVVTQAVGLDVNSAVIKDVNGNVISHDAVLPQSSEYTVNYTWSIPDGVRVRSGDTMTVQIPANVEFPEDDSFTMVGMTGGKPIGTFFIAAGSHTGTITLNSQFQYRPLNRRGYLHLAVEGTEPDQPGTLAQIAMSKSGTWADPNNQTKINWSIDVLANGNQLVNPVITDQLSDNQTYVAGSAHLTDELGNTVPVTTTVTGNQIEFQASGAFVTHLNLSYQTTTNEPTGSAIFTNFADYTDDGGNSGSADASVDRVTEPENPGTSEPENPGTSEPENPGTTEPENPGTSEPENPGTSEPENPGTTEPENPGTSEPENPDTTEPENPGTSEPENPGTTEPEQPATTAPDNSDTSVADAPATDNSGATPMVPSQPDNGTVPTPQRPTVSAPATTGTTANGQTSGSATSTPTANGTPALTTSPTQPVPAVTNPAPANSNPTNTLPQTNERTSHTSILLGLALLIVLLLGGFVVSRRHSTH
ncbi:LPXTG cell wall anchor domain-containing protein [Lactiplantibacillus garii]|uniref:LPXTG cell wall anchor domain-containing protein n=1 Tax=Lactiplantibacillus garii TaxID=2306423 RepID=A0A3R8LLL3_9LACO|nr:Ig-like domain-containing protein [Lactiplantibacillus garii]RRK11470.1 LPXTG cell wall anchor domain-containing protein [Lactiplantibacillus garii]